MMSKINSLKGSLDNLQAKARERTVKTQNVEYDLETLVKRIDKKAIRLDPEYQRRHRWHVTTSSRLIESLILNIPIPVVFISQDVDVDDEVEEETSRYTVIDGQQRLTAIYEFMKGKFALEGLETLEELNGLTIKELPPFLSRRLDERTVKCLRIDSTVDVQVKYDIFERLNTGSVKLESQELRNATARGPFNDAIKKIATFPAFRKLIQVDLHDPDSSPKVQKMEDAELVLRFFALRNQNYRALKKGFRSFLTSNLVELNDRSAAEIDEDTTDFKIYMTFILEVCGPAAFAKWRLDGKTEKRMSTFNAAVFDAVAVGLADVFPSQSIRDKPASAAKAINGYKELFLDQDFFNAVSGSVNDAAKVATRIDAMVKFLQR